MKHWDRACMKTSSAESTSFKTVSSGVCSTHKIMIQNVPLRGVARHLPVVNDQLAIFYSWVFVTGLDAPLTHSIKSPTRKGVAASIRGPDF